MPLDELVRITTYAFEADSGFGFPGDSPYTQSEQPDDDCETASSISTEHLAAMAARTSPSLAHYYLERRAEQNRQKVLAWLSAC